MTSFSQWHWPPGAAWIAAIVTLLAALIDGGPRGVVAVFVILGAGSLVYNVMRGWRP